MEHAIVCVMGIPAAGKTTFCNALKNMLAAEKHHPFVLCHICYDKLFSFEKQQEMVRNTTLKMSRDWLVDLVEILLGKNGENASEDLKRMKQRVLEDNDLTEKCAAANSTVFVVDDNLYYRSMRYKYIQLARKYETGFGSIFLDCELDVALRRNAEREEPVPKDAMLTMASKMEEPVPSKNSWEEHSITIRSKDAGDEATLDDSLKFIAGVLKNPLREVDDDSAQKELAKSITSSNLLHQADIVLRKLVGEKIRQQLEKKNESREIREYCQKLRDARASVVEDLKAGRLIFPDDVEHCMTTGDKDQAHHRMKSVLEDRLHTHLQSFSRGKS